MRVYLSGQRSFANRGCEAIVRSSVSLLRERYGAVEVLLPSDAIAHDSRQWPRAAAAGVRFVPAYYPRRARYWAQLQRLPLAPLKRAGWPFPLPRALRAMLAGVDAVLAVGGDNYSLDYRLPSLPMAIDRLALDLGRPVILWGASVGPFEAEPAFVPLVREQLARMRLIAARESITARYLHRELGLSNVVTAPDPAFTLTPEPVDIEPFWPQPAAGGVLGLNASPLLQRYRRGGDDLLGELAAFVERAVREHELSVLLVPHVLPADDRYLKRLLRRLGHLGGRVRCMDPSLNAGQIKHVIGRCRYFIGARTHATIAAFSSGVPTVSIAYSVKARGINQDLFGHTEHVLDAAGLDAPSLAAALGRLIERESPIRTQLQAALIGVRQRLLQTLPPALAGVEEPWSLNRMRVGPD